ncbi:MAG: hypothetical protein WC872_03900 [Candidatus Absconditabacterales bacterium]
MKQKVFLIILIAILSIGGISIFKEFLANHTYYNQMLNSGVNWKLFVWAIVSSLIPIYYILKSKKFSLKTFMIRILPAGLLLFGVAHTIIKESIVGGSAGFIIFCINNLILYFLGMYFVLGVLSLGTWISNKILKFKEIRRQEMFINFGIGIGCLLLGIYILMMVRLFYPLLTWIIFLGLGGMIWLMKAKLIDFRLMIEGYFAGTKLHDIKNNAWKWMLIILIGISIIYYFYGFQLSFIPYSTAWDANHEYMYAPKVLAENFGVLRGNIGPVSSAPLLWHSFIAFWFSLIQPIKSWFWLAPDTIAVAMNFLSGIFVLLFGIGLTKQVLEYFGLSKDEDDEKGNLPFYFGWISLLFWLTSGMGAFLVFVDNKTDLGVLAMTILAILSGFIFLGHIKNSKKEGNILDKGANKYLITSGFIFTLAVMAKPTAFIDTMVFGLLLLAIWIDEIVALGLGIMTIGFMGVMKVANASDLMGTIQGKYIALIGLIIILIGIIRMFWIKKQHNYWFDKKVLFRYIIVRILSFLIGLVIFKGPNVLIKELNDGNFGIGNFAKSLLLLGKNDNKISDNKILLTLNDSGKNLDSQNNIDKLALENNSGNILNFGNESQISLDECKTTNFTKDELNKNLLKATVGNEDVGRYVGYGWKEISKGGLNVGYGLLRLFYRSDNKCFGLNAGAKLLCTNGQAIDSFNIPVLTQLFNKISKKSEGYQLLSGALATYKSKNISGAINPNEFRDQILALRQYYQDHAIKTEYGKISIPYRYIIPFNVVFNRSLQNLSSYYTDIGFIRLFLFVFIIAGLIYGIVKDEKNLRCLTGVTIIGWGIRWIIGGGIVWYGIGLIIRTGISAMLFIKNLMEDSQEENKKTMFVIALFLFAIRSLLQFVFNFIRISSQGASGPFAWYKMTNGKTTEITERLEQKDVVKSKYSQKDVFDLQFPHYNKFIDAVKDRSDDDGVLIAGTYIQYFLKNQHNINFDGMLNWFWEQTSDNNSCKSYKRLQDKKIKYLVIDPNIGTVAMGEGNETLFDRFFAKRDPVTGKMQKQGAISELVKLRKDGYLKLFGTNNMGAKYAFSLSDEDLIAGFGDMTADDLLFLRAKLSIARFFPDSQTLINFIANTFTKRIGNGLAIGDIADIYGKPVDESKIGNIAQNLITNGVNGSEEIQKQIAGLSQDERIILLQYLGLFNLAKATDQNNAQQYQQYLNNLLGQSLGGGSQLIVFELK